MCWHRCQRENAMNTQSNSNAGSGCPDTTCSALRFSTVDELREHVEGRWTLEKCPKCQARLLTNNAGDKWCSYAHCDYGMEDKGPRPCPRCGHLKSITNGHCFHCATTNAKCPDCGGDTFRDESRITWCHECGWNHSPQNSQAQPPDRAG